MILMHNNDIGNGGKLNDMWNAASARVRAIPRLRVFVVNAANHSEFGDAFVDHLSDSMDASRCVLSWSYDTRSYRNS